ncbi:unnamed protein product [Symbiodinium natans]|uniref:Uncharacterized protein n=1 Tax=Symbiodinium natans TaxID=878477 RepID=A0A812MDI7_9DINO|nr:unnamed protein product [Symbiodinium natans]CAE7265229.1 unnamed protein product [Symbiodinium natans]
MSTPKPDPLVPRPCLPKAFVAVVVLVYFSSNLGCFNQELSYAEFFAGEGNVFRAVKKIYAAAAVDIEYAKGAEWGPNNPMDLNGAAGLAQGDPTPTTSSLLLSAAAGRFSYVYSAAAWAAHSWWSSQVYRICWWMKHYGSETAKRHQAFTNNKFAGAYNRGKLCAKDRVNKTTKTTRRYVDSRGRTRWNGTAKLKQTQVFPSGFGLQTVRMMPQLMTRGLGKPSLAARRPGPDVFAAAEWSDWDEARLAPVIAYLRGNKSLMMPCEWKSVFPVAV